MKKLIDDYNSNPREVAAPIAVDAPKAASPDGQVQGKAETAPTVTGWGEKSSSKARKPAKKVEAISTHAADAGAWSEPIKHPTPEAAVQLEEDYAQNYKEYEAIKVRKNENKLSIKVILHLLQFPTCLYHQYLIGMSLDHRPG